MTINFLLLHLTFYLIDMILTVRDWLNQKERGNVMRIFNKLQHNIIILMHPQIAIKRQYVSFLRFALHCCDKSVKNSELVTIYCKPVN